MKTNADNSHDGLKNICRRDRAFTLIRTQVLNLSARPAPFLAEQTTNKVD